ncbi:response regulator [Paracerasibacillus soli]|uniref:Response regulatory domain-containing protein n=1 Tax=Paracerasibacillus soli TaxID=480284 RepID=A0ABU5CP07_9BACI|nr:hypothetical protein [Virgibacillus soli]MDY0407621.1 hypothetical protein [Virgibacillus soli]
MAINILLIEEDEALGKGLQTYFKKDEFVMEWINDSNAAITYVHQFLPEVIILSNENFGIGQG